MQFLRGTGDYLLGLRNLWAKQLSWDELRNFLEEYYQEKLHNFGAQLGLHNFWREFWFPSRIAQFPEGPAQPPTHTKFGN